MNLYNANVCRVLKSECISSDKGFTLVEILVAMFILSLIVFAFTPLLVNSIESIHFAGDKSEALYEGQSIVEVKIAEQVTSGGSNLVFDFGGTTITVPGGLVEAKVPEGEAMAWLKGYLPYIPSMNINPPLSVEGYSGQDNVEFEITVNNSSTATALSEAVGGEITIYDNLGFKVDVITFDIDEADDNKAVFTLSVSLLNSRSPYMAAIKWDLGEGVEVYVQSRFQVVLPYAAAVGAGQRLWVSPEARETWKVRNHQATGTGAFRDIIWTGFEYVAVSDNGRIAVWNNRQEPELVGDGYGNLRSVAYGRGTYLAVGGNGYAVTSGSAVSWGSRFSIPEANGEDLNAVSWSDLRNEFVVVGTGGTVLSSSNGEDWTPSEWVDSGEEDEVEFDPAEISFNGVAYGGNWLAVGKDDEGAVICKLSGDKWIRLEILDDGGADITDLPGLNDVVYDGENYYVVGDSGILLTSSDARMWDKIDTGTEQNLNAIDWGDIEGEPYNTVIVGNSGVIIAKTLDNDNNGSWSWKRLDKGFSHNMYAIALRWTR